MKRGFFALLILSFCLLPVESQENRQDPSAGETNLKHGIGMAAGWSTGYGISYRYWPGKVGFQLTATPYFEKDFAQPSLGVAGLLKLTEIEWLRFFLYLGNHYLYRSYENYSQWDEFGNPVGPVVKDRQHRYIAGIGPGFEFLLGKKFGLNLMFGFRSDWHSSGDYIISFTGESGVYYRF